MRKTVKIKVAHVGKAIKGNCGYYYWVGAPEARPCPAPGGGCVSENKEGGHHRMELVSCSWQQTIKAYRTILSALSALYSHRGLGWPETRPLGISLGSAGTVLQPNTIQSVSPWVPLCKTDLSLCAHVCALWCCCRGQG